MTESIAAQAEPLNPSKKVACVGRFLVDVPLQASGVEESNLGYMLGTIESERLELNKEAFQARMEKRKVEIQKGIDTDDFTYKDSFDLMPPNGISHVFVLEQDMRPITDQYFHSFEAFLYTNHVLFSLKNDAGSNIDNNLSLLKQKLLPNLRARNPDEIPDEPGICFKNGFVATNGSPDHYEGVGIDLLFKQWPDLRLTVSTSTMHAAEPFFLERISKAAIPEMFMSLFSQVKTLRRGEHDVGDIKAGESLEKIPTDDGYKRHLFHWESNFELNDPYHPSIVVELVTGQSPNGPMKPTISDEDAIKLFDAVVNSIRLRPTHSANTSQLAPHSLAPSTALGDLQATGRACPQTGWWQTSERGEIEGGAKRLFRQGEVFPAVKLLGEANVWQKLKGERPAYQTNTVWQLVAYEAADKPQDASGKPEQPLQNNGSSPSVS